MTRIALLAAANLGPETRMFMANYCYRALPTQIVAVAVTALHLFTHKMVLRTIAAVTHVIYFAHFS
jgi:hypothetical protein